MAGPILGRDMAVDLGTYTTQVYVRGKGVLINEATPRAGTAPIRDGVIADVDAAVEVLTSLIERVHQRRYFSRPRMLLTVPAMTTAVERRALKEAAYEAGARQVSLVDAPLMAAIGAGLPVHRREETLVVTLGAGLSEIAVLSLGGVVSASAARVNGADLDRAIVSWMRAEHGVVISEETAEDLKWELGRAWPGADAESLELAAPDLAGRSRTVRVSAGDLRHALAEPLRDLAEAIAEAIAATSAHSDAIRDHGVMLAGGGALLPGLDLLLSHELTLPVLVAPHPVETAVAGAGRCVDNADLLRSVLATDRRVA